MIALRPPEKTEAQLRAIAASGATGLSRKAQAELQARMNAKLQAEVRKQG
jgi:hypothetical protein